MGWNILEDFIYKFGVFAGVVEVFGLFGVFFFWGFSIYVLV